MPNHADPCVLVIFGASGELTRRKLLPAIYNLAEASLLPDAFAIVGVARPQMGEADFRAQMRERVAQEEHEPLEPEKWKAIEDRLYYVSGEFDDASLYDRIKQALGEIAQRHHAPANYLFYFAIPPEMFGLVATQLAASGLTREDEGWRRVIIEKPFGYDLDSARALNAELSQGLRESQIYRIDHYLGKETVQNILALRFANGIFEPIWNRRYVDHVQMTVAEDEGIGTRGVYYDKAGALRDIVQNHMLQLLTLVAMEPPISFNAEDVRDEKVKVLHAVVPLSPADVHRRVVRGQYTHSPKTPAPDGTSPAAENVPGYREEANVAPESRTETFVAMRLTLDNWRWADVPFYLRAGKRLPRRVTEIAVQFKRAPFMLFRQTPVQSLNPNMLVLRIQPDEGICLSFDAKVPGPFERLDTVDMDFSYARHFKTEAATGYETLLFDAMTGDQTLFHRMDIVEAGWQAVMPVLETWRQDTASAVPGYRAGSWGPPEADLLIEHDGREWRR